VVPHTTVVFENERVSQTVVSDEEGRYEVELPAGVYRVRVTAFSIFDPFEHKKLKLRGGKVKKFDVLLRYDTKKHPPVT